jgi:glycerol-3-phosphate dehydrogenase
MGQGVSTHPLPTFRPDLLARLAEPRVWDLAVVGGGASGLGVALQAARLGLSVLLLEAHDFAQGTSSRSTKLLHGGVRYLAQGHLPLVYEALHERRAVLDAAPHIARPLSFVMPAYRWGEQAFYGAGLKLYDVLAGRASLGVTRFLGREATLQAVPGVKAEGLRGGVQYWDGQFDDARLALALARTAALYGALVINHMPVTSLIEAGGRVAGLRACDAETGRLFEVQARCVVNAAGVWVDGLRGMDAQTRGQRVAPLVQASQGIHLVVDASFWPGEQALLVPSTRDGRVLFAVPWLGKVLLGTTDTPRADALLEPVPLKEEVDLVLQEAGHYLARQPTRADVRSVWAGLRPLVNNAPQGGGTSRVSREHRIDISESGLLTVTGGKWTTFRAMGADVLKAGAAAGLLPAAAARLAPWSPLVGALPPSDLHPGMAAPPGWHSYGAEAAYIQAMSGSAAEWLPGLSEAMVRFAARHEYARTVEDVLARRSRLLMLDAQKASHWAPRVAEVLLQETGVDPHLPDFEALARQYAHCP